MTKLHLRNRHPVSDDVMDEANQAVEAVLGIRPLPGDEAVEKARAGEYDVLLVNRHVFVVLQGPDTPEPLPTLRALMQTRPSRHEVTVDMGAVPHLRNGADVMSPGIIEADASIEPGDVVWVTDEEHGAPLGIGHALIDGGGMVEDESGKAIETWHHVGDELWSAQA